MRLFSRTLKEILRIASHFSSILYPNGRFSLPAEKSIQSYLQKSLDGSKDNLIYSPKLARLNF